MRASFPRSARRLVALAAATSAFATAGLGLGAASPPEAEAACRNANLALTPSRAPAVEKATRCLINEARARRGVGRLRYDARLAGSAGRFARSMVVRRFFSHDSPGGSSPDGRMSAYRAGARGWRVGENLGYVRRRATARRIYRQWMGSSGHRSTMLNGAFRDAGVGAQPGTPRGGGRGGTFVLNVGARG